MKIKINSNPDPSTIQSKIFTHFESHELEEVILQLINQPNTFQWRLIVNGNEGPWYGYYQGIYEYKGFGLVTEYHEGPFKAWTPFKIKYGCEI